MMTWVALRTFLLQPKVLITLALLAALAGYGAHFYSKGKTKGFDEGKVEVLAVDKKEVSQEQTTLQQQLNDANARAASAQADKKAADSRAAAASSRLTQIVARQQAEQQLIAAMTDPQLLPDITRRVGLRAANDATLTLYPNELRQIDEKLAGYDALNDRVTELDKKVSALADSVIASQKQVVAAQQQTQAAVAAFNTMHEHYVRAYNAAQPRPNFFVRALVAVKLKRKKTLDLPDPVTLNLPAEVKP